jgi:hypothetical protein
MLVKFTTVDFTETGKLISKFKSIGQSNESYYNWTNVEEYIVPETEIEDVIVASFDTALHLYQVIATCGPVVIRS